MMRFLMLLNDDDDDDDDDGGDGNDDDSTQDDAEFLCPYLFGIFCLVFDSQTCWWNIRSNLPKSLF